MTQIPAGWYPDPDPNQPEPRGQRYWDGQNWTDQVNRPAPPPTTQAPTQAGQRGGYVGAGPPYLPMETNPGVMPRVRTTPDGEVLAGWGRRAGAFVIDQLILGVLVTILGFSWVREIGTAYADYGRGLADAVEAGSDQPSQSELLSQVAGPMLAIALLSLLVGLLYYAGFLKWRQATPGKMLLGLKVRLREQPGPLSWRTVLLRWLAQFWYALVRLVPLLGFVVILYPVLDLLWPLWDDKNQALHDKIARTNVVRVR